MSKSEDAELLGVNVSTATHKLKRNLLFRLAEQLDMTNCHRCGEPTNVTDYSIDHIEPWRGVGAELFWNLDNIALSHKVCNKADRPNRKVGPDGTAWCASCKEFKSEGQFATDSSRWNGLSCVCLSCDRLRQAKYAERNPRFPCPTCGAQMRKKCPSCKTELSMKDYMRQRRSEGASY